MFEIAPKRAADVGCVADAFTVIATDGAGNAFGLYLSDAVQGTPWVYRDHEIDTLAFIAPDTLAFFSGLLAERAPRVKDASHAERVRGVLRELGVAVGPFSNADSFLEGQPVKWLRADRSVGSSSLRQREVTRPADAIAEPSIRLVQWIVEGDIRCRRDASDASKVRVGVAFA